jgi:IclR family transcriptional regulator, pca regulon regulatory protein
LHTFNQHNRTLRLNDIATMTGLGKSAAQRFVHSLHTLGYLRKDEATKQYSLSPRVLELGFNYLSTDPLVERSMPYLHECNKRCEESVNLSELNKTEIIYVARVPGRHVLSVDILLGTRFPAYCTAPGRAMLAFLADDQVKDILNRSDCAAITPHTITDRRAIMDRLEKVRSIGYELADQEIYIGDVSVAAPVLDYSGRAVAAVKFGIPSPRGSAARVERDLAPVVIEIARAVSLTEGGGRPLERASQRPAKTPTEIEDKAGLCQSKLA